MTTTVEDSIHPAVEVRSLSSLPEDLSGARIAAREGDQALPLEHRGVERIELGRLGNRRPGALEAGTTVPASLPSDLQVVPQSKFR